MLMEKNCDNRILVPTNEIFHYSAFLDAVPNSDAEHHWDAHYSLL
jgi:hypothetical protein